MTGGSRANRFLFASGSGNDTIADFKVGAELISIGDGATDMEDLSPGTAGDDVIVSCAEVSVTVGGVSVEDLSAPDYFLF